jgi:hypothetical protein
MSLWFAEIRCRELMFTSFPDTHLPTNEFDSARDRESRITVDIDFALQQGMLSDWNGSLN